MKHIHRENLIVAKVYVWIEFWYVKYYTERIAIHAFICIFIDKSGCL